MISERDAIEGKLAFQSPPQTIDAVCGDICKVVRWDYIFDMLLKGEFRYVYACRSEEPECQGKPCMNTSKSFDSSEINYS